MISAPEWSDDIPLSGYDIPRCGMIYAFGVLRKSPAANRRGAQFMRHLRNSFYYIIGFGGLRALP
ncbi:MAG: hypothetical protein II503_03320, partial [Clostridia bacterium]|nr:hypothetical protein [Clostridia bacterium]